MEGGSRNERPKSPEGASHDAVTCSTVARARWVERYLVGNLTASETEAFESHYLTCPRCQEALRLGAAIRAGLAGAEEEDLRES